MTSTIFKLTQSTYLQQCVQTVWSSVNCTLCCPNFYECAQVLQCQYFLSKTTCFQQCAPLRNARSSQIRFWEYCEQLNACRINLKSSHEFWGSLKSHEFVSLNCSKNRLTDLNITMEIFISEQLWLKHFVKSSESSIEPGNITHSLTKHTGAEYSVITEMQIKTSEIIS